MMFSPGSLRPAARSMEDHFDCFENVSQLSMDWRHSTWSDPAPFVGIASVDKLALHRSRAI